MHEAARSGGRRGLTLVEVAIASAVLAVLLLGLFTSMAHAMRMDALAREREAATRHALQELDDHVNSVTTSAGTGGFDDLADGFTRSFHVPFESGSGAVTNLPPARTSPNPSGMAGYLEVTSDLDDDGDVTDERGYYSSASNLVQARASVRWRGVDGLDQEVVLISWKARPEE